MPTVKTREGKIGGRLRSKSDSWWVFGEGSLTEQAAKGGDLFRSREKLVRRRPKPSVLCKFTRHQILALFTLILAEFISFAAISVMAPFFPREAGVKGMSTAVSGLVFSFYALVVFLSSPLFGKILPKVGAKFLFMSGIFLAGSCNILFGLEAVGASAYATASFVYVVEIFPDNISAVLGLLETAMGLGMSAGPAIGGIFYAVGGFGLPFYILGGLLILIIPLNWKTLPTITAPIKSSHQASFGKLLRIPSVIIIASVIIVASNTWSFLDPTLEPHLSVLNLTSYQIGLIFLMFASLYGFFSPIWGWLADKVNNHWSMMVIGLFLSAGGLLILGPSPLISSETSLWMDLLGLCLIGVSVALTLMPTFQAIMQSAEANGLKRDLTTYSIVAGAWSCMYSLGDMTGPALGGILSQYFGFHICTTVMAGLSMITGFVAMMFFLFRCRLVEEEDDSESQALILSDSEGSNYTSFRPYPPK